jgi:mercuric ion transport protein
MSSAETKSVENRGRLTQALAATGLAVGLLASSCCLLPLLLLAAGIGGAWISGLTALSPYQPLFLGAAGVALGWGFWRSYRRPNCAVGLSCDRPGSVRSARILQWLGAAAVLTSMSINIVVPLIL